MTSNNDDESDSGINITLGKLVSYPAGILLTVLGVLYMIGDAQLGGLLITVAGLFALPVIRRRIAEENGVSVNRWATVAIVLIVAVSGFALVPTDGTSSTSPADTGGTGSDSGVQLITADDSELVPTIDDFEAGWRGQVGDDGTSRFQNVEDDESVIFNVTVFDSVEAAETALQEREPDDRATSDVSFADAGYKYPITDTIYRFQIRERNAVCQVYFSGSFDAESAADRVAGECVASMNQ